MTNIATLGLKVESAPVKDASKALDKFKLTAAGAELAERDLAKATEQRAAAEARATSRTQSMTQAMKRQTAQTTAAERAASRSERSMRTASRTRRDSAFSIQEVTRALIDGQPAHSIAIDQAEDMALAFGDRGLGRGMNISRARMASVGAASAAVAAGLVAMGATVAGVTHEIDRHTDANVQMRDVVTASIQLIKEDIANKLGPAWDTAKERASSAWDGTVQVMEDGVVFTIKSGKRIQVAMTTAWDVVEAGGAAAWGAVMQLTEDGINALISGANKAVNVYRDLQAFLPGGSSGEEGRNPFAGVDLTKGVEGARTIKEVLADAATEMDRIDKMDIQIVVDPRIRARAEEVARDREAEENAPELAKAAKAAAAEQAKADRARERALATLSARSERYYQDRLRAEDDILGLIEVRLASELAALDEIAREAVANGADAAEVSKQLITARRDLEIEASLAVSAYRKRLDREEAEEQKRLDEEVEQNRRELTGIDGQLGRFDNGLAADRRDRLRAQGDPNAGVRASDLAGGVGADQGDQLTGFGFADDALDVQARMEEQLTFLQEMETRKRELLGENHELVLEMEREFEARRVEVKTEAEEEIRSLLATGAQNTLSDLESAAGSLGTIMSKAYGEGSKAAKAAFAVQKGIALARAVVNTAQGVTEAIASAPFPANIPAIAFATATGAAQIATIAGARRLGGPVSAGSLYEVGEGGRPELFREGGKSYLIPGNNGSVSPERRAAAPANDRNASGGQTINAPTTNHFHLNGTNPQEIIDYVDNKQRETEAKVPDIVEGYQFDRERGAA